MILMKNDVLRRLRYALDILDADAIEIFALGDYKIEKEELTNYYKKDTDEGFVECSDFVLACFLDGLITKKRGRKDDAPVAQRDKNMQLSNNAILKKIRIALNFQEQDMLTVLARGGNVISKSELSALFRQKNQKNYKECGDQILRNFLTGLNGYTK